LGGFGGPRRGRLHAGGAWSRAQGPAGAGPCAVTSEDPRSAWSPITRSSGPMDSTTVRMTIPVMQPAITRSHGGAPPHQLLQLLGRDRLVVGAPELDELVGGQGPIKCRVGGLPRHASSPMGAGGGEERKPRRQPLLSPQNNNGTATDLLRSVDASCRERAWKRRVARALEGCIPPSEEVVSHDGTRARTRTQT